MTGRQLIGAEYKMLGFSKIVITSPATTNFAPDLYLPNTAFKNNDRLLVVCLASCATPTTSTLTWFVQDAPDSAGAIGTPAAAVISGTLAGGTGDDNRVLGVLPQVGRPWLRVGVTAALATDVFVCHALVLAVPPGL